MAFSNHSVVFRSSSMQSFQQPLINSTSARQTDSKRSGNGRSSSSTPFEADVKTIIYSACCTCLTAELALFHNSRPAGPLLALKCLFFALPFLLYLYTTRLAYAARVACWRSLDA